MSGDGGAEGGKGLPPGWAWARVQELAERLDYGHTASASEFANGPKFLRITDITDDGVNWDTVPYCICDATELSRYRLANGDIVFARTGATTGKSHLVTIVNEPSVFASYLIRLRTKFEVLDRTFLAAYFRSGEYWTWISRGSAGSAQPGINASKLAELPVPVPPLAEQRRIVAKLDGLLARSRRAKEALAEIPALLEHYRQSVLAAAFRGDLTAAWRAKNPEVEPASELLKRIRAERRRRWEEAEFTRLSVKGKAPVDDRWKEMYEEPSPPTWWRLADLPSDRLSASLEMLTDAHRTIRYGILMPGPDLADGVPYIKVKNIKNDRIELDTIQRTSREMHRQFINAELANGDLVVAIRGTYGRLAAVPPELHGGNVTQDSARVAPLPGVNRDYLMWIMRSPQVQGYWKAVAKGVAVQGVNISDLRPTGIPMCSELEQCEVVRTISVALERITRVLMIVADQQRQVEALDRATLARAFCGELVPQDPNDEPASIMLERIRAERAAGEGAGKKPGRRPKSAG